MVITYFRSIIARIYLTLIESDRKCQPDVNLCEMPHYLRIRGLIIALVSHGHGVVQETYDMQGDTDGK
jgi:hypothetical protein